MNPTLEDRLEASLSHFRGAVRNWSDNSPATRWTVISPADHLDRMILPALETPWYRSLWSNLRDLFTPDRPLPDITSKPVLVRDIWGQYGRQKKSWLMSLGLQSAAVALLFTLASTKVAPEHVRRIVTLFAPPLEPPIKDYAPSYGRAGGGGGDGSVLPPSKGRLPEASLKPFTPPVAVANNLDPKLTIEPAIAAPPDLILPQVNMAQYGDPLAKLGPASNGPGSGSGIGSGPGGGVGPGSGPGYGPGPGDGGSGLGPAIYRAGAGGVSAPALLFKVEPEYSEEARKAKYQGTALLYVTVDPSGRATNIRVVRSLGLGLDEKAIEAVRKWKFKPGYKDGRPVPVAATIEVNFRLL